MRLLKWFRKYTNSIFEPRDILNLRVPIFTFYLIRGLAAPDAEDHVNGLANHFASVGSSADVE